MIERFEDDVDGPTNLAILIEGYQALATTCREVGELEIAETCEERIRLIRQRQHQKKQKQNSGA